MTASFADLKAVSDLIWWENVALAIAARREARHESPLWPLLVAHWDEAVELLEGESRGIIHGYSVNLRSTETYRLVRSLIEEKT